MKGQRIGYVRVSTPDQNPDRQLEGIELDRKFIDIASGKTCKRIEFENMMIYIRSGDHLFVHNIDRVARNVVDLVNLVKDLNRKGIVVEFVKEKLLFSPDKNDIMSSFSLHIIGAVAELELGIIKERQREGIAIAKGKGKYLHKRKIDDALIKEIVEQKNNGTPVAQLAKLHNVTQVTIYNYLKYAKEVKIISPGIVEVRRFA